MILPCIFCDYSFQSLIFWLFLGIEAELRPLPRFGDEQIYSCPIDPDPVECDCFPAEGTSKPLFDGEEASLAD